MIDSKFSIAEIAQDYDPIQFFSFPTISNSPINTS